MTAALAEGFVRVLEKSGGEGGIRTPGRSFSPYNGLANRRIQPLCHLSADGSTEANRPNTLSISLNCGRNRRQFKQKCLSAAEIFVLFLRQSEWVGCHRVSRPGGTGILSFRVF